MQEHEVKLASSKQKKSETLERILLNSNYFTTCATVSCEQVNDSENWLFARIEYFSEKFTSTYAIKDTNLEAAIYRCSPNWYLF